MAGKDSDYRIFVGGLSWDITERQLENAFSRFGKVIDSQTGITGLVRRSGVEGTNGESWCVQGTKPTAKRVYISSPGKCPQIHIMIERDTGRPRGFGFLTFSDRRGMEDAIREMHGSEIGERVISVNKAQPKMGSDDPDHGYGGSYPSRGRGSYGGADRSLGQDECFKCGRPGHWACDCPSAGGGRGGRQFSSRSRFSGSGGSGNYYSDRDRDRFMDDRYDGGSFGDRDRYDIRESKYGSRSRYSSERYPSTGDRFGVDRYGAPPDRYPQNGYGRVRDYDRDVVRERYGSGGPARYEGRSYRDRADPYDRPKRGGGGGLSAIDY